MALLGNMTEFLRVGAIYAETFEFSGGQRTDSRSNVFQIPSRICLRAQPLKNSAGRVPQAADCTCNKISRTRSCRSPRTV